MADYNIQHADTTAYVVSEGTIDETFSSTILGQNATGFGKEVAESVLQNLENFASDSAPAKAVRGQLWFDTNGNPANGIMRVWTGANPDDGGYNAVTDGSDVIGNIGDWIQISTTGISGTEIGSVGTPYTNAYIDNIFATSGDFDTITVQDITVENSLMPDVNSTNDVTGQSIGSPSEKFLDIHVRNAYVYNNLSFNASGGNEAILRADPTNNETIIPDTITTNLGNGTQRFGNIYSSKLNLSDAVSNGVHSNLYPTSDNVYGIGTSSRKYTSIYAYTLNGELRRNSATDDIGTSSNPFQTAYAVTFEGTATQAKYADLAERYESDKQYPEGTIVKIGGEKEITATTEEYDNMIGVVSMRPAYLMNKDAGTDDTHPAIALTGRIPVRVIGAVKKGQRIITSEIAGVGKATDVKELLFVGFALHDKDNDDEGLVEVIVGAK